MKSKDMRNYEPVGGGDETRGGRAVSIFQFKGMPRVLGPSRRALKEIRDTAVPTESEKTSVERRVDPWDMHTWPESSF